MSPVEVPSIDDSRAGIEEVLASVTDVLTGAWTDEPSRAIVRGCSLADGTTGARFGITIFGDPVPHDESAEPFAVIAATWRESGLEPGSHTYTLENGLTITEMSARRADGLSISLTLGGGTTVQAFSVCGQGDADQVRDDLRQTPLDVG